MLQSVPCEVDFRPDGARGWPGHRREDEAKRPKAGWTSSKGPALPTGHRKCEGRKRISWFCGKPLATSTAKSGSEL